MHTAQKLPICCGHTFRVVLFAILVFPFTSTSQLRAQGNSQRGAAVGGIAGAVAGAAIGDHNGEAGAGAAIGGILGAFAGGLLGNAEDKNQAYQNQRQYQQSQQQIREYQRTAVSTQDVVAMTRNGLSEQVIINQIEQRGVQTQLQVADIISLHQQGVSEQIIAVMQQARYRPTTSNGMAGSSPLHTQKWHGPVVVPMHGYHVVPQYPVPRCYYYPEPIYHHYRAYSSGIHIRF